MISQTAEYALRAIVFLAGQEQVPHTTVGIAEATQIPVGYLAKVMQNLSRAGLVNSQRGLGGGFTLAYAPHKLTVLAIVNAVDPIKRYPVCPLGLVDHGKRLCPLHSRLDEAAELVEKSFAATTVADLITMPRGKRRPCTFPTR
jgi:Rrf2 family protein